MALRHTTTESPIGPLTLVVDDEGALAGLYLPDHVPAPPPARLGERAADDDPALSRAAAAVLAYLDGTATAVEVPLAPPGGTAFQQRVWQEVAAIPRGQTRTYGEVAAAVGNPGAGRAVGAAIGRNPQCLAVPCHRVVGSAGAVTGYAGGVERKRWLLALEGARVAAAAGDESAGPRRSAPATGTSPARPTRRRPAVPAAAFPKIFVNLPVADLEASKGFFSALGFSIDPQFTNDDAACVVVSDTVHAMLLTKPFFEGFTGTTTHDPHEGVGSILALGLESRAAVDELADRALAAGAKPTKDPDDQGSMYGRSFADLDGHRWEAFWMDPAAAGGAPEA